MRNKKIAIIDEDKSNLRVLKEVLISIGYTPVVINDAFSAVATAVRSKPDAIILELRMPHLNGFELAYEMNRIFETEKIPIIAMSSLFKNDPAPLMNLCGIHRYLRKPINPLDVIWAVENVIEESNNQLEDEKCLERVGYRNYDLLSKYY